MFRAFDTESAETADSLDVQFYAESDEDQVCEIFTRRVHETVVDQRSAAD